MRWIAAALAALMATPVVAAHATPEGAEYERLVWQDGTFHQTYYQDGYDLHDLWMWEAYDPVLGDGMMLRFHVYGGNSTGLYDTMWIHAQLGVGNDTRTFSWWSTDDVSWQGDLPITLLASNHTAGDLAWPGDLPDEVAGQLPALPDIGGGWAHEMQVFVPLSALNATVGDTVTGWTWHTTVERDTATGGRTAADVDVAPGGFWITGSPEALPEERPAVPDAGAEPGLPADAEPIAFFLQGAGRHVEAAGEWADGEVVLRIRNPYNATTQVAMVTAPSQASMTGATVDGTHSIAPGQEAIFRYHVPLASGPQHLVWEVLTDIGGRARLELTLPAAPEPAPAPEPTSAPPTTTAPAPTPLERTDPTASPITHTADPTTPAGKDAPMGAWVGLAVFAAVMLRRRE